MSLLKPLLLKISDLCFKKYRLVLFVASVANVSSLFFIPSLRLDPSVTNWIPDSSHSGKYYHEMEKYFGDSTLLIVSIDRQPTLKLEHFERFVEILADKLSHSKMIRWVHYRLPSLTENSSGHFLRTALLKLDDTELAELASLLRDESIHRQVKQNRHSLEFPYYLLMKTWVKEDPLNLRSVFLNHIKQYIGNYRFGLSRGYFSSTDKTNYLILAQPTGFGEDLKFCADLLKEIKTLEAEARETYRKELSIPSPQKSDELIQVGYAGRYAYNAGAAESLKRDFLLTFVITFIGVLLLFFYVYRHGKFVFLIAISLVTGLLWTGVAAALTLKVINFITCATAAILTGLTIDYGIHFCNRFQEEMATRKDVKTSLAISLGETGQGILLGAITTSASFLSLAILPNKGIAQLGFISGVGIFLCMLSMLIVLPSLLVWNYGRGASKVELLTKPAPLLLERLSEVAINYPIFSLSACIILTVFFAMKTSELEFNASVRHLLPRKNESIDLGNKLTERFGGSFYLNNVILIIDTNRNKALKTQDKVDSALEELLNQDLIASYESVRLMLPPEEQQQENIKKLFAGRDKEFNSNRIRETFYKALDENKFIRLKDYEDYLARFGAMLSMQEPLTIDKLRSDELTKDELNRFIREKEGQVLLATYVWPRKNVEAVSEMEEFTDILKKAVHSQTENAIITGPIAVLSEIGDLGKKEFFTVVASTFVVIFSILFLHFRDIKLWLLPVALLLVALLLTGLIWMLGTMVLLDIQYSISIICSGALVIGMGIDDGIHILQRYKETQDIRAAMASTGSSVVLTSLTTIIAFGSLLLANHMTLYIIGLPVVLGTIYYLLCSLILLPAALQLETRKRLVNS